MISHDFKSLNDFGNGFQLFHFCFLHVFLQLLFALLLLPLLLLLFVNKGNFTGDWGLLNKHSCRPPINSQLSRNLIELPGVQFRIFRAKLTTSATATATATTNATSSTSASEICNCNCNQTANNSRIYNCLELPELSHVFSPKKLPLHNCFIPCRHFKVVIRVHSKIVKL